MSDFLGRLAERSLGMAPLVQPVVPAMTAPASKDTGFGEVESFQEVSVAAAKGNTEREPRIARAVDTKRAAPSDEVRESRAVLEPQPTIPAPGQHRESSVHDARRAVTAPALDSTVTDPAAPERARNSNVSGPGSARGAEPISRARREDAANVAPVIRVTIGRVEVRAEIGQTKARHAPVTRSKPAGLSLDEYLKQRGEGRR